MRNIIAKTSLFCLLLLAFSCAKDIEYLNAGGDASSLKVKIDGTLTEFQNVTAVIMDVPPKKALQIIASKGTSQALSIMLSDYQGKKTYDLNEDPSIVSFTLDNKNPLETTFLAEEGKVVITSASATTISGTFEFKAKSISDDSERIFKEGSFTITIADPSKNPSIPVNPSNANMKAKINNTSLSFAGEANLIKATQPIAMNSMMINGYSDKKMLSIMIDDYKGVGTYEINDTNSHMMMYTLDFSQNAGDYSAISGKIIVTSSTSSSIKGTFEFIGEKGNDSSNKITVKEGTFEMSYKTVSM